MRPREVEPVYHGLPLSYWLKGYYASTNAPTRADTDAAMRQMGTNASPTLLRMLRGSDSLLTDKVAEKLGLWLYRHNFVKFNPPMQSDMKHFFALWGMSAMDPEATRSAVPQLIEIYDRQPNRLARQIVAAVLSEIGPPAKAAVPELLQGTADTNDNVRMDCIFALGQIHAEPDRAVPVLTKCLRDPLSQIRGSAARALGTFGEDARPALPALKDLLKDERAKSPGTQGGGTIYNWTVGITPAGAPPAVPGSSDIVSLVDEAIKTIESDGTARDKWPAGLGDKIPAGANKGFR